MAGRKERENISFTANNLANAKDTDLPNLLTSLGYQVRRVGSYYTTREMDSLRIKNRRTWYRYSERTGGDAIDFMQHFEGKSFPEAVDFLLTWNGRSLYPLFFLRPTGTGGG